MSFLLAVLVALWVGYACFGRRWRIEPRLGVAPPRVAFAEPVVAVVPARNEAAELPRTLAALLGQTHADLHVVLVDDHSDDGTAEVARRIADERGTPERLTVLAAPDLPPGWIGKVWAQHQGVTHAQTRGARWVWLTDADVRHDVDVLERLLATAYRETRDLVSIMARLRCANVFEKLLIPAFTYFFATVYSFHRTRDDRTRDAGAAGGCVLVRAALLERVGGMAAIRDAVIDDCTLARVCKDAGGRLWLGYHAGVESTRGYPTLGAIWNMVARSAYTQLRYNPLIVAGVVAGLAYVFLLPVGAIILGPGALRVMGLVAYAAMVWTYRPMVAHLGCEPAWAFALPLSATLYAAMTVSSAWRHHRGTGVVWKGRAYRVTRAPGTGAAAEPDARA